jgi:group I intron endonuclease
MGIIYCIRNRINGKRYIGSSTEFEKRKKNHIAALRHNYHPNPYLQSAWNKYGEVSFEFLVLDECSNDELMNREQILLDTLNPEYNICPFAYAPMRGRKHTKEFIDNLREMSKKNMTKEKLQKLQNGRRKNRKPKAEKIYKTKNEIFEMRSKASKKLWAKPSHHQKMSDAHKNYSDDIRNKIRKGVTAAWANAPEKWADARKGKGNSKHTKDEIIEIRKEHFENKKTARQIAKDRNESYGTIRSILYSNWKWVNDSS